MDSETLISLLTERFSLAETAICSIAQRKRQRRPFDLFYLPQQFLSYSSPPWQTATVRIHTLALRSCVIFYSIITASGYDSRLPCSSTVLRYIIACQALLKVLFCILHSGQVTTCCDIPQGIIKGAIN